MLNKKIFHSSMILLCMLIFLSGCGAGEPPTQEVLPEQLNTSDGQFPVQIIVYTPENMMDDNMISDFDERANITVIQRTYTTDEELISIVTNPPGIISMIIADNYAASTLINQNLLSPLDPTNIPNLNNIDGRFRNLTYDPLNQFCAPFAYNTVGIGYINGQEITPVTWADIFRLAPDSPAYGRVSLLNHPREVLGAALIHLGYNPNTTNETEVGEAKNLILQSAASYSGLDSLNYGEQLATFQTVLAQGYSRDFYQNQQVNSEMNYAIPLEGALLKIYNYCIPTATLPDHKKAAEVFINLALEKTWAASAVLNLEFPSTVVLEEDQVAMDTLLNPLIYPPNDVLDNAKYLYFLGTTEIIYTTAWEEIANAIR